MEFSHKFQSYFTAAFCLLEHRGRAGPPRDHCQGREGRGSSVAFFQGRSLTTESKSIMIVHTQLAYFFVSKYHQFPPAFHLSHQVLVMKLQLISFILSNFGCTCNAISFFMLALCFLSLLCYQISLRFVTYSSFQRNKVWLC